jgi:hypothetical protein
MSRAFVKDADDTFDELPDRPISPHPNIVTPEGLAAIEAALTRLLQEREHVQANDRAALAALARELRYGLHAEHRPKGLLGQLSLRK